MKTLEECLKGTEARTIPRHSHRDPDFKLTRVERELVTQYCVRFPITPSQWRAWAESEEAQAMVQTCVGKRLGVAKRLVERARHA